MPGKFFARGPNDVTAGLLAKTPWLVQADDPEIPPNILGWDLGRGESAVLAWALAHPRARAIIDDLHGRRCAESLGIPSRGTVGLVLRAHRALKLASARDTFERSRAGGMYHSDRIVRDVSGEADEL